MATEGADDGIAGLIRDSAAAFVSGEDTLGRARAAREGDGGFDRALWAQAVAMGWTGLLAPEGDGGGGLGLAEAAVLHEALGRGLGGGALIAVAHLPLLAARHAGGPVARALVADIAAGRTSAALAFQPASGALSVDLTAVRAIPSGDGVALKGEAHFVPLADTLLVAARGADGIGLYHAAADAPGVRRALSRTADGASLAAYVFDGVAVPASAVVAPPGEGLACADAALDGARILMAAELVGVMREAFARTLDYLGTRTQFGRHIGAFQALQHRAVDLHVQIELSAAALEQALEATDGDAATLAAAASAVKARAGDAALLVTREAIQMHGAIGYTREHDIGLFLDRALTLAAALGNAAAHRRRYGLLLARTLAA